MSYIEIRNLQKKYNEDEVLKGIDLDIEKGEVISIIGSSGGGKSTFLRCLIGLEEINGGEINIPDRKKMGMVFQSFNLFPHKTVAHNIMESLIVVDKMDKKVAKGIALELLDRVGLRDKADVYPKTLSGGQKQRVAIARALVNNPSILFADEPTGNLDSQTGHDVMQLFHSLHQQGQTIILITHENEIAAEAQRTIFIKDGLIESDTRKE